MNHTDERITILAILDGWKGGCWNIARTRKPFAVEGIDPRLEEHFCKEICATYPYDYEIVGHNVFFNPRS